MGWRTLTVLERQEGNIEGRREERQEGTGVGREGERGRMGKKEKKGIL